jgi:REP element-mobilizing transposase RayT
MPNHVHTVLVPYDEYPLNSVLHSWKSYTSNQINKLLQLRGAVWESESFDHLVRSAASFERFVDYTEANPVAAGLCTSAPYRVGMDWGGLRVSI